MKNYCNILTSRKYIEKKTKKNFGEDFTVNNCTACKTKEEKSSC